MPYIVDEKNEIQFIIDIHCNKCMSWNCDFYIKEADEDGYFPYSVHEIRYRCKNCGNLVDKKEK
jgi:hypothetical protein